MSELSDLKDSVAQLTKRMEALEKKGESLDKKCDIRHYENLRRLTEIADALKHQDECVDETKTKVNTLVEHVQALRIDRGTVWGAVSSIISLATLVILLLTLLKSAH